MIATTVEGEVRALQGKTVDQLRAAWPTRFGPAPRLRSGELVRRLLAERLQQEAFGRDTELERRLAGLVAAWVKGRSPSAPRPTFKPGTVLRREYDGERHEVEVLVQGFRWRGQTYASLSEIARAITCTRWNGPRFFGLRDR